MKNQLKKLITKLLKNRRYLILFPPKDIHEAFRKAKEAWSYLTWRYWTKNEELTVFPLPQPPQGLTERQIENCHLLPNRTAILHKMKKGGVVAEVGVAAGGFSRSILDICSPSEFHLIDLYLSSTSSLTTTVVSERFRAEINEGIVHLHEGDSSSWLAKFPDSYFDFIYIDGDHSYQGVKKDVQAGKSKVKDDGFLIFNDYTYWSPAECVVYGIVQAVNELCLEENWEMIYFALQTFMYCDVAIRRQHQE
jgi:hypothetical protein